MALVSTYTSSVSNTFYSNVYSLRLKGALLCSRNLRGILFQILAPVLEKDSNSLFSLVLWTRKSPAAENLV